MPGRLEDLVKLPGVGRKTANVVLGNAFGVPGITVDTHFGRLARRFGWTDVGGPGAGRARMSRELFPKSEWTMLSHRVVFHGRRICHARKPACGACPIAPLCPSYGEGETDPEKAQKLLKYEKGGAPGQRLKPPPDYPGPPAPPLAAHDAGTSRPTHGARLRSRSRTPRRRAGRLATGPGRARPPGPRSGAHGLPAGCPVGGGRAVRPEQLSRFLPPDERRAAVRGAHPLRRGRRAARPAAHRAFRRRCARTPGSPPSPAAPWTRRTATRTATGPVRAALREAEEETGLDPAGVQVFGVLPRLYIPVSGFVVTPVLGWWREPSPVGVVDPAETARVFRVPVADLTDPANRATLVHPSGFRGPAFLVEDALVWGFTAGLIDKIMHFAGWELPWDRDRIVPLG